MSYRYDHQDHLVITSACDAVIPVIPTDLFATVKSQLQYGIFI